MMASNITPSTSTYKSSNGRALNLEDSVFVETCFNSTGDLQIFDTPSLNEVVSASHRGALFVRQRQPSSRRRSRSFNFCIYGVTLLIPGVALIIVYFFLFGNPSKNGQWSPSDAFVITGAVLVALSAVAIIVGLYQYCVTRIDKRRQRALATIRNEPPSYSKIAKISKPSVSFKNNELPPTFESCFAAKDTNQDDANSDTIPQDTNHDTNGGVANIAFINSESCDFPPPSYEADASSPTTSNIIVSFK